MLMIYGSKYPEIDNKMSDCQMGGRKKKGCKNNIFILNAIIHDVLKSKKMKSVLYQFYDYSQMFDAMNLQEAISDIYDTGVDDENMVLLYEANKEINMAVKTANGLTERQLITDTVSLGDTWGSMLASVQVDKIGQDCMAAGYSYLYKNILPVGFLRQIERIEEGYLRKILKTQKGCPIIQLYLEMGHIPTRFEIHKMRLLYLK